MRSDPALRLTGPIRCTITGLPIDFCDCTKHADHLVAGVDYEPAKCDNCGKNGHTPDELVACIDSMLGPGSHRCGICEEMFRRRDERAEMYDTTKPEESVICHAQCGIDKGMEIA